MHRIRSQGFASRFITTIQLHGHDDKGTSSWWRSRAAFDGSDSQSSELTHLGGQRRLKYKYFMVFLKDGDAVQGALKVDAILTR